jgi:hypothetical protein
VLEAKKVVAEGLLGNAVMAYRLAHNVAHTVLQKSGRFSGACLLVSIATSSWHGIFCITCCAFDCMVLLQIDILAAARPCIGISTNNKQAKKCEKRFNMDLR